MREVTIRDNCLDQGVARGARQKMEYSRAVAKAGINAGGKHEDRGGQRRLSPVADAFKRPCESVTG